MPIAIGIVCYAAWALRAAATGAQADAPAADVPVAGRRPADIVLTATASDQHPVYRYSIVPGGVHMQQDVSKAMTDDPVVARHYRKIDTSRIRVEKLASDRLMYVSYRKGDLVYWTKRPVRIPAAETVLTDGGSTIRARCGNCLSMAPMLPTSPDEPESVEFDALVDTPQAHIADVVPSRNLMFGGVPGFGGATAGASSGGGIAGGFAPGGGATGGGHGSTGDGTAAARSTANSSAGSESPDAGFRADDTPPSGGGGGGGGDHDPPADPTDVRSAPEPALLILLGTGVSALVLRRFAQRRERRVSTDRL